MAIVATGAGVSVETAAPVANHAIKGRRNDLGLTLSGVTDLTAFSVVLGDTVADVAPATYAGITSIVEEYDDGVSGGYGGPMRIVLSPGPLYTVTVSDPGLDFV